MIYGEAGLNLATFYQGAGDNTRLTGLGNITRPEFSLYVKAKYPTLMGFDAGVSFSQQGSNAKDSISAVAVFGDSLISKAVLNYGYVFADGIYYFELQGDNSITAGAGLYLGYLMNGDRLVGDDKRKLILDDWKRFDFGLQLKTAFNIHDLISLGVQYRIAFIPTVNGIDIKGSPNNLRNSVLNLSVGVRLFQKIK
ncbi:hypothetical protein BH10BAC2_BH10BAC2_45830 [soil metagenome]